MDARVLRLDSFRPVRPAFDEALRRELMPALAATPGVVDACVARQGPDETGPRLIASVWTSEGAMTSALCDGRELFEPPHPETITDSVVRVAPLLVARHYRAGEAPRIMRVFRGRVRPGELAAYAEDVRLGSEADAQRADGPVAVYMAGVPEEGPDAFVTLSTWCAWPDIEAATGGDIHRPRATRRPERLRGWEVDHFEVVAER